MKNTVIIKSFPNGISVYLDETLPFEELLSEVAFKFRESSHFFKDAHMVLSLEGRKLNDLEERRILDTICENCELHIVCLIGKDEETQQNYLKALQQLDADRVETANEGHFYRGALKNGQILETESSIVVLGDIYPGSSIISTGDIVVLGGLYGRAYAGGNGREGHFVAALEMSPEKLKIGDFKYKNDRPIKWSIKPKVQPKIAYVKNSRIVTEPITKELLSGLTI